MTTTAPTSGADVLLRRQLQVTVLALLVMLSVYVFVRSQGVTPPAGTPIDEYVQAHHPPPAGNLRLAYLQLFVTAAVAVVVLGHAARVVAFVFRKEAR